MIFGMCMASALLAMRKRAAKACSLRHAPDVISGDLKPTAALRMRLDINQLPRPFQIAALGNKDWNLASDWKVWQATLPAEAK